MPCFTSDALILTSNGYKSIQSLSTNDLIYTHNANWKQVVFKEQTLYSGPIIIIKTIGNSIPIYVTSEQQFMTKSIIGTGLEPDQFELSKKISSTPASSLNPNKHMLCLPIEQIERPVEISINIENEQRICDDIDWFMVGIFAGKNTHILELEFVPPGWSILREFTSDPTLEPIVCNKIPEWIQKLPSDTIDDFLRGFEYGAIRNGEYIISSESVALSIQRLYAKLKKFAAIIVKNNIITLDLTKENTTFADNKYLYIPIESITDVYKEIIVYNINVADDKSFVIDNVAVF